MPDINVNTWTVQDSLDTIGREVMLDTREGLIGGAIAGAIGGPYGIVGSAIIGAGLAFTASLIYNTIDQMDEITYSVTNGYRWTQSSMNLGGNYGFAPVGNPLNESDGTQTHTFRLDNGFLMKMNVGRDTLSLIGTTNADTMVGKDGKDVFQGGAGNDIMTGHQSTDTIYGNAGNDRINGGSGNDRLIGGPGVDTVIGGSGADFFYFNKTTADRDFAYFDPAMDWVVGGSGFHITRLLYDTDARGVHRITDIYLTGDNHLHLQRGDGGDGRLGMGYDIWTPAEAEAIIRNNQVHDFFDA